MDDIRVEVGYHSRKDGPPALRTNIEFANVNGHDRQWDYADEELFENFIL